MLRGRKKFPVFGEVISGAEMVQISNFLSARPIKIKGKMV